MKKIYISADIEGIWGNAASAHTMPGGYLYEEYRTNMINEVNLVIDKLFDQGVDEILVNDGHGNMDNLLPSRLDPRASLVTCNGGYKAYGMMEGLDDTFDGMCLIGYHCRANTHGVMAHTIWGTMVRCIVIDGQEMGESGINERLAREYGVPVILVSGDHLLHAQLEEEFDAPYAYVETKQAVNAQCAINCSWNELIKRYEAAVKEAIPYAQRETSVIQPHHAVITFHHEKNADFAARMEGVRRLDACSVQIQKESYDALYRSLRYVIKNCNSFA